MWRLLTAEQGSLLCICCVVTRLAVSYCCGFSLAALGHGIDSFEKYHVFLIGGPAVGMADS